MRASYLFARALLCASVFTGATASTARAQQQGQSAPPTPPAQTQPAQPCRASQEYRQLDFWVGEWEVRGPKGKQAGNSSVQLILNDCVVFENWTGAGGYTGKSFNLYDARTRKWKQIWVDGQGQLIEFIGEFRDGAMRYASESTAADGKRLQGRMTFFPLAEGRVRQLWEQSADGGKTWNTVFDGTYIKKSK